MTVIFNSLNTRYFFFLIMRNGFFCSIEINRYFYWFKFEHLPLNKKRSLNMESILIMQIYFFCSFEFDLFYCFNIELIMVTVIGVNFSFLIMQIHFSCSVEIDHYFCFKGLIQQRYVLKYIYSLHIVII